MTAHNVKLLFKKFRKELLKVRDTDFNEQHKKLKESAKLDALSAAIYKQETPESLEQSAYQRISNHYAVTCHDCGKPLRTVYKVIRHRKQIIVPPVPTRCRIFANVCKSCYEKSESWQRRHSYEKNGDDIEKHVNETTCKNCFRKVIGGEKLLQYCSNYCQKHWQYLTARGTGKGHHVNTCPECNKEFTSKRSNAVYCSQACKQKVYRRKAKA